MLVWAVTYCATPTRARTVQLPSGFLVILLPQSPQEMIEREIYARAVATSINLPAMLVAIPIEEMVVRLQPNEGKRTIVCILASGLSGVFYWFYAGQFLDDLLQMMRTRLYPDFHRSALVFAIVSLLVCFLSLEGTHWPQSRNERWYFWGGTGWTLVASSALIFRLLQLKNSKDHESSAGQASPK
jgi:hypothetical protein